MKRMRNIAYQLIRSKRKTIAIQIEADGTVLVRSPLRLSEAAIQTFVESKSAWIEKHLEKLSQQPQLPAITDAQIQEMTQQAREVIPRRVTHYASILGVDYGRITIRHQRTRWGSCSGKGNLNFNCLLMAVPTEVLDYVVVHELCHRKEMNHSPRFWAQVEKIIPDYKTHRQWLKDHAQTLIGRTVDNGLL